MECDDQKRDYILRAHPQCLHVFSCVSALTKKKGFCHRCGEEHAITRDSMPVHFYLIGPSCKDLSPLVLCMCSFWMYFLRCVYRSTQFAKGDYEIFVCQYGCFLEWWYPTTMGFPTKNDHFGVFWGYHHLRKPPYINKKSVKLPFPFSLHFPQRSGEAFFVKIHLEHSTFKSS